MAKRKFAVQEDDVFDDVETKEVPEIQTEDVECAAEPAEQNGEAPLDAATEESEPAAKTEGSEIVEEKAGITSEPKSVDTHATSGIVSVTQSVLPVFNYKKKKESRNVKKLVAVTPTMDERITTLLKKTYNGMPFNALVNELLKEFIENHGIKIEDDTF